MFIPCASGQSVVFFLTLIDFCVIPVSTLSTKTLLLARLLVGQSLMLFFVISATWTGFSRFSYGFPVKFSDHHSLLVRLFTSQRAVSYTQTYPSRIVPSVLVIGIALE